MDTLESLHKKFQAENKRRVSYSTFYRCRPFWVIQPTDKDRETCACKLCENMKYMTEALHKTKAIDTSNPDVLLHYVVCSKLNKRCMYGECQACEHKKMPMIVKDGTQEVSWKKWKTIKENRILKNNATKEITLTVKHEEKGTLHELIDNFHDQIWRYRRHIFNITNQHRHYKLLKEGLKENECFMHIDFAENYVGKMTSEIQSMHFGASKPQITLHTGYYVLGGKEELVSFSGVSDSLQHDPAAIWAFLKPLLLEIKDKHPRVDFIHFYSDGPTTQYRQKTNFYFFSTEVFEAGFKGASWNFLEAGHGKGIPDGVGGTLKRTADHCVRQGKEDIMNADAFIKTIQMSHTSIKLYKILQSDIDHTADKLEGKTLKTVPGTMNCISLSQTPQGISSLGN